MIQSILRGVCCCALAAVLAQPALAAVPRYDHVLIVVMENHGLAQIVGNSAAPYITSLSLQGANFTNSHGVGHPSQPNYLALFSGSTQRVINDKCPVNFTGVDNLGAQLAAAGLGFTGYSESMPAAGDTDCSAGEYVRKHNPWVDFNNVPASANQPWSAFPSDYRALPTVAFVVPNLLDDMHDGSVRAGDAWLQANIAPYVQWARTHNSLLILTFDEDDYATSSNLVPTIWVGPGIVPGNYGESINHYNVLATVESMYGLPALTAAQAVTDVFGATATPPAQASATAGAAALRARR